MKSLLLTVTALTASALFVISANIHVVRVDDLILVVHKHHPTLTDTYVDARGWNGEEWNQHQMLIKSMLQIP